MENEQIEKAANEYAPYLDARKDYTADNQSQTIARESFKDGAYWMYVRMKEYVRHKAGCNATIDYDPVFDRRCKKCKSTFAWHRDPDSTCPSLDKPGYTEGQLFEDDNRLTSCSCDLDELTTERGNG